MTPYQRMLLEREATRHGGRPSVWQVEEEGKVLLEITERHLREVEAGIARLGSSDPQAVLAW